MSEGAFATRRSPSSARQITVYVARVTQAGGVILTTTRDGADNVVVTNIERPEAKLAAFDEGYALAHRAHRGGYHHEGRVVARCRVCDTSTG